MMEILKKYSRLILAGVLVIAGIFKIIDPENLVEVFLFFGIESEKTAYLVVYIISFIEIILSILLILNINSIIPELLVTFTCIIFLTISLIGYFNEWQMVCGCLGRFSFGKFDISMITRNSILLLMASLLVLGAYKDARKELTINKNQR